MNSPLKVQCLVAAASGQWGVSFPQMVEIFFIYVYILLARMQRSATDLAMCGIWGECLLWIFRFGANEFALGSSPSVHR